MNNVYAIIDYVDGHLVNLVVWDGNLETWQPPDGTYAVSINDIDLSSVPQNPDKI